MLVKWHSNQTCSEFLQERARAAEEAVKAAEQAARAAERKRLEEYASQR